MFKSCPTLAKNYYTTASISCQVAVRPNENILDHSRKQLSNCFQLLHHK